MKNLKVLINTYRYDVIHAHTMFNIGWAMLAGKLCGVPVRISHAHSALTEKRSLKVRIYEAAMRFLIRTCANTFAACGMKAGARLYGEHFFKSKGTLILNGIDTQSFSFDTEKRHEYRTNLGLQDKIVIGQAEHLATVKNQVILLNIKQKIKKKQAK